MRQTDARRPIRPSLLQGIKRLSGSDVADPAWRFAIRGVTSNLERHTINLGQLRRWAQFFRLPLARRGADDRL